jgi:archaellum component FlaF (FlaF/FlaG flagellin family)
MGFETVAATIIIIGGFMYFGTDLYDKFNDNWQEIHDSLESKNDIMKQKMDEDLIFSSISYAGGSSLITVVANNTGTTIIDKDLLDIYVDGVRIPRNNTNRTITVVVSTEYKNPGLWDPYESISSKIKFGLASGIHSVELYTQTGNNIIGTIDVP